MEWKRVAGGILRFFGKGEMQVGEFSSTAAGKGLGVNSNRTALHRVYADDAATAMTAGTFRAALARFLVTTAVTIGATICGFVGQIKVGGVAAAVDWLVGLWGYAETVSGATVGSVIAGVRGTVDIPSGAAIASGKVACAFVADSIDLSGTHTGKAAAIHVPNPGAGTWDSLIKLGSATGGTSAGSTKTTPTGVDLWLVIDVNGTTYYAPMYTSKTA